MPLDPSVFSLANKPGSFGPDLREIVNLQNLAQQMQARKLIMDQEQQGQNALRQVFSDPANIGPGGVLTPNALRQVAQASPPAYMQLLPEVARAQQQQTLERVREGQTFKQFDAAGKDLQRRVVSIYGQVAEKDGPEAAQKAANEAWREGVDQAKSSGLYPDAWTSKLPLQPPPIEELRRGVIADDAARAKPLTQSEAAHIDIARGTLDEKIRKDLADEQAKKLAAKAKEGQQINVTDATGKLVPGGHGIAVVDPDGGYRWAATGAKVEVPPGGNVDKATAVRQGTGAPLTDDAIDLMARRALEGDRSAVTGLGYGSVGADNRTKVNNRMAEVGKAMGKTPEQIATKQNEFRGQAAEFQTLGRRTAGIELAVEELSNTIPALITASNKVDRTQVPLINQALLAAERGTGDENVVEFGIALNAVIKAYAQAMNPTGVPRVDDQNRARELLSTNWTKGQIQGGVDQLNVEINAARKAPKAVWDRLANIEGPRGPEFTKQSGDAGGSPAAPAPPPAAAAAPPPGSGMRVYQPGAQ